MMKLKENNANWYLIDASEKTLGRLATCIAHRLRGKHRPEFAPNRDMGDFVVVINAEKIRVTGNKFKDKMYYHHTGFMGGIKEISFDKLQAKAPERILEMAVKNMLPKGPLGRKIFSKLKVYAGVSHPHAAQNPVLLDKIGE
jgi:large subunit ribosomal protein L13